jgi:hypothetical protein
MKNMAVAIPSGLLPAEVTDLAIRLGAAAESRAGKVRLAQSGEMREGPEKPWMRFTATESVDVTSPAFDWRALTGPLSCFTVVDRLSREDARSELRLFGLLPLFKSPSDAAALQKGQIMRYLAEIPWAPDAIFRNRTLDWTGLSKGLRVSHSSVFGRFSVDIEFDADGRIGQVSAPDRSRLQDGRFLESAWRGRFTDYRLHCDRWIPFRGEVGWVIDAGLTIVWRAQLSGWSI